MNVRHLLLERTKVLHERLLVAVLMYVNETMVWKEKKRSRTITDVQMNNLRSLKGIRRNRTPNAQVRKLWCDERG